MLKTRLILVFALLFALVACGYPAKEPQVVPEPAPAIPEAPAPPPTSATPGEQAMLPLDPAILHGTLSNGLQYFVRGNHKPENRAELRLVVNAGSVLEDEDQQGLAHFVEHMAFNGTKNFEKQELVDYLESIGMRFGADLNAYTSMDETVYMLQVPTDDQAILVKAFQILEDWAHQISFDGEEIDKERGVVVEEWRLGRGAQARIQDKQFPLMFQGSRYAERLTIGKKEILENCSHDTLRRFYEDWYRPDLMAVIAVGDFDPRAIEKKIKEQFGNIPARTEKRERTIFPVPDHEGVRVSIETDPEMTMYRASVLYKRERAPEGTEADSRRAMVERLYHGMLNSRLSELTRKSNPPFLFAYSGGGRWVRSKSIYTQGVGVEEGGMVRGLEAVALEAERVRQHGFTQTELERSKLETLRSMEQAWKEKDKARSGSLASEYVRVFLWGEAAPGIEVEYELAKKQLPGITLQEVNALAEQWMTADNRVLLASGPEKDGVEMPTREALLAVLEGARAADVDPFVDEVRDEPLVATMPVAGKVVEASFLEPIGATYWTLSNGVRVILKPTDFKNDQVLMSAYSYGGNSLVGEDRYVSAQFADTVVGTGGVGNFSSIELGKKLAGKVASAGASIGSLTEGLRGSASPQDLETMFQLVWLRFTAPRRDEEAYGAMLQQFRGFLANQENDPNAVFNNRWTELVGQGHYRMLPFTVKTLDGIDLDTAMQVYRERFADASGFTFTLVGNFDLESIQPLVELWLGGLPASGREETWKDPGLPVLVGVNKLEVRKGIEPKSRVRIQFSGDAEWGLENDHLIRSMTSVLSVRLREVLREDMGGVYGVGVNGSISRIPNERFGISIQFGCDPERTTDLIAAVYTQIERLKNELPEEDEIASIREKQTRGRETGIKENGFWRARLQSYDMMGQDPLKILEYDALVELVTAEAMQATARKYFTLENVVEGVLYPE